MIPYENDLKIGTNIRFNKQAGATSYITSGEFGINTTTAPKTLTVSGSISASGDLYIEDNKFIYFDYHGDSPEGQSRIRVNDSDLQIGADRDIKLQADRDVHIQEQESTYATFLGDERLEPLLRRVEARRGLGYRWRVQMIIHHL